MPVLVTQADTTLGTALVRRLLATGGQVRAYCSAGGDVAILRAAGAIVAAGDVDDEGRLEAACEQVHTVIHLAGGLLSPSPERIVADAASVANAAGSAGVHRLVLLSVLGASPHAQDDLRRAMAAAEQLVAECPVPSVALRVPVVLDDELREVLVGTPLPEHVRTSKVAVIGVAAAVDVLAALDDVRSESTSGHAAMVANVDVFMPVSSLAEAIVGPDSSTGGNIARGVYRPLEQVPLLAPGLLGPWHDDDEVASDAWAFTGIDPAGV